MFPIWHGDRSKLMKFYFIVLIWNAAINADQKDFMIRFSNETFLAKPYRGEKVAKPYRGETVA